MIRFIVVGNEARQVKTFETRRDLIEYLQNNAEDVENIYRISRDTDRYIDYMLQEDEYRYEVKLARYEDDEFGNSVKASEYRIIVIAKTVEEAKTKAINKIKHVNSNNEEIKVLSVNVKVHPLVSNLNVIYNQE